jgi:predicted nucleic acid-binding protein
MARLIDTSLWVDFTRPKSPAALKTFILPWLQDAQASLCEPVAFEVLRHATPAERTQLEAWFSTFPLLPTPRTLWRDAASLGQRCRAQGVNAGSLDLIIAAIASHHQAELITFDSDFTAIARITAQPTQVLARP